MTIRLPSALRAAAARRAARQGRSLSNYMARLIERDGGRPPRRHRWGSDRTKNSGFRKTIRAPGRPRIGAAWEASPALQNGPAGASLLRRIRPTGVINEALIGRASGVLMSDEIKPEVQAIVDQAEASLQRIAMRIIEMPRAQRDAALDAAKRNFEASAVAFNANPDWATKWVDLNMQRLRGLLIEMEAGGGRGGRA